MSNPGAEAQGPISVEQAVSILDTPEAEKEQPEAPDEAAPAQETEAAEPTAEDGDGAETQSEADATEVEPEPEAEEANQAALEPPKFWDAEAKKRFGELPRDVQEIIRAKEDERTKATARQMQEAAESKKQFEATSSKYAATVAQLDKIIPQAQNSLTILEENFQQKWGGWLQVRDWGPEIDHHGVETITKIRLQIEGDQKWIQEQQDRVQQLSAAKSEAEQAEFQKFVAEESAKLEEIAPELTDAKLGAERKQALGKFLVDLGVPVARIPKLTAVEAALAYDAMKWRNGQAKADALIKSPQPVAQVKRTPAKPTASAPQGTTQQARLQQLSKKRELSIAEAVELANLKDET